jgi:hypothetical protein
MSGPARGGRSSGGGFTMLELLVALTVLVLAFSIIWSTFSGTVKAWRRGSQLIDELHHGDFVMEQLVAALRSAAFFPSKPEKFGFWLDDNGDRDEISWVTSGATFMPPGSPLAQGLHRLMVTIESDKNGDDSFTVRAFPHLKEEMDEGDVDAWHISSRIKGLSLRTWNTEDEVWEDEWEDTNTIPGLVEITLLMEPIEKYDEPVKMMRLVEIPMGPATTSITASVTGGAGAGATGDAAGGTGQPAPQPTGGQPAPTATGGGGAPGNNSAPPAISIGGAKP